MVNFTPNNIHTHMYIYVCVYIHIFIVEQKNMDELRGIELVRTIIFQLVLAVASFKFLKF